MYLTGCAQANVSTLAREAAANVRWVVLTENQAPVLYNNEILYLGNEASKLSDSIR